MPTKQFNVSLGDALRSQLEAASEQSGKTIADEIRTRLSRSFQQDAVDKPTLNLIKAVLDLADFIRGQSGYAWFEHTGAKQALMFALQARLARMDPSGPPIPLEPGPRALVHSNDPSAVGLALEALHYRMPGLDDPRLLDGIEKAHQEITQQRKGDKS
jgi:hypothetical protein